MKYILIGHNVTEQYEDGVCNDVATWDIFFGCFSSKEDAETERKALSDVYEYEDDERIKGQGASVHSSSLSSYAVSDDFGTRVKIGHEIQLSWHDYSVHD